MRKVIILVASMVLSAQALAWGDREQGIVTGIGGTLLLQHIFKDRNEYPDNRGHHHYHNDRHGHTHYRGREYWQPNRPHHNMPLYQDTCRYRGQQAYMYDHNGNIVGWRYC